MLSIKGPSGATGRGTGTSGARGSDDLAGY